MTNKKDTTKHRRPPIVVVVGHIDHGKTTLLDAIRKTKVAEKESGGITQHIGAYEIEHNGHPITFIDTPGHEAFSKMRGRGAAVADIGILVVAADEGVKPQTKEAIATLQEAGIPFLVAMNKIDKPGANIDNVKKELSENNIQVESWGGKVPSIEISAKQGTNLDELLELILLMSEVEELEAHEGPATGIVIESHRDKFKGCTATLLILDGVLNKGDFIAVGGMVESVKILENFLGKAISSARYSMPVVLSGLSDVPEVGEKFQAFSSKKDAEAFAEENKKEIAQRQNILSTIEQSGKPTLLIVLKSDVSGSKEAIEGLLEKMQYPQAGNVILKSEVGDVNEADVRTASVAKNTVIAAFKVKVPGAAKEMAERNGIKIIQSDIIYDLQELIKTELSHLVQPEIERTDLGRAKILAIFKKQDSRQIIGGKVTSGKLEKGAMIEIQRGTEAIGKGKIRELQQMKQTADEVREGFEFGTMVEFSGEIKEGDSLVAYQEEKIYPKL